MQKEIVLMSVPDDSELPLSLPLLRPTLENSYEYMGLLLSVLLPGGSTHGRLSIIRGVARAGTEPPPHVHLNEHETYLVTKGKVEFFLEGKADGVPAEAGDLVFLPHERAHALKYHTEKVETLMFLEAVEGKQSHTEEFFRHTARGRATSLDLTPTMTRYAELDQAALAAVASKAKEAGIIFLTENDIRQRLPKLAQSSAINKLPG